MSPHPIYPVNEGEERGDTGPQGGDRVCNIMENR